MTIHLEWEVLLRTIEAQLAHNLQALENAEMLREAALNRVQPSSGTRCPRSGLAQLIARGAALSHSKRHEICPVARKAEQRLPRRFCIEFLVWNWW